MTAISESFKNKVLVITGDTGSFGSTVLKHFLSSDLSEIRIISHDEKKQDWMRHTLQSQYPTYASKVSFYIGDVRNIDSVREVMFGANYGFFRIWVKKEDKIQGVFRAVTGTYSRNKFVRAKTLSEDNRYLCDRNRL